MSAKYLYCPSYLMNRYYCKYLEGNKNNTNLFYVVLILTPAVCGQLYVFLTTNTVPLTL